MSGWQRVVFAAECDEDGNCPICLFEFADCTCPGPTQDDEYEYEVFGGHLMARPHGYPTPESDE